MSVMQYSERLNSKDVQVWDNAAFDNGESEGSAAVNLSWSSVNPVSINLSQSFESCSSKENQTPTVEMLSPHSSESSAHNKPLRTNNIIANAQRTPRSTADVNQFCPVKEINIDFEIEEIEKEISRLSSRLESLRLEKARRTAKSMEKRGRIVAAKFKDPPRQSSKTCDERIKIEESMGVSVKLKTPRRGLSMGPSEIMREARRGISLGPVEIYSASKLKQLVKQDITTPVQPTSSWRKSCYWKLNDIDELRVAKGRGKSMSLSPKSRAKTASQVQVSKQAATTIGSKKGVKKEDGVISSIQPKKLFAKDGEKSAPGKKPLKSGRVVASRYNQIPNGGISAIKELRKRSLPENEEDSKRFDRKRVSLNGKFVGASQNKHLEMPSEVAIEKNLEHRTPLFGSKMLGRVPMVKTFRYMDESPRDSGPAKRASEMVGRKSCFSVENVDYEEGEEFICHGMDVTEQQVTREYPRIVEFHCNDKNPQDLGATKKISQLVERKPFFNHDEDAIPVFSFEEQDGEN